MCSGGSLWSTGAASPAKVDAIECSDGRVSQFRDWRTQFETAYGSKGISRPSAQLAKEGASAVQVPQQQGFVSHGFISIIMGPRRASPIMRFISKALVMDGLARSHGSNIFAQLSWSVDAQVVARDCDISICFIIVMISPHVIVTWAFVLGPPILRFLFIALIFAVYGSTVYVDFRTFLKVLHEFRHSSRITMKPLVHCWRKHRVEHLFYIAICDGFCAYFWLSRRNMQ